VSGYVNMQMSRYMDGLTER